MPTAAQSSTTTMKSYDKFLRRNYLTFDWGRAHELFARLPGSLRVVAINQHFMQSCAQLSKSSNALARKLSAAAELCVRAELLRGHQAGQQVAFKYLTRNLIFG